MMKENSKSTTVALSILHSQLSIRMPMYRTLEQADLRGKCVLLRAGFDVPIEGGKVVDTERIEALVPTMKYILEHGASLVIMAHQGRPKGKVNREFSQKPLVPVLEKLLKMEVQFADSCTGSETEAAARNLKPGEVLLLENLRFDPGEEKNDPELGKQLAALGDIYVNDAFTNCHRNHASMVETAKLLPAYAGIQLGKELQYLSKVVDDPRRPLTLIISGAKMETKIPIIENFLTRGDDILIGGCVANAFIAARGFDIGRSKVETAYITQCQELMLEAEKKEKADIHVPRDVVVASKPDALAQAIDLPVENIEGDMAIFDIGKMTTDRYCASIAKSGMIVWNGPMGLYEVERFAGSSMKIADAVREASQRGAITIIGGGDTIDFHRRYGKSMDAYTFVSTGGGAMLEFIGGKELPALQPLEDS